VRPAMMHIAVYAKSQGRRLAIDAASPPPESIGAVRAVERWMVLVFR
jgi:hypothetical protein